MPKPLRSERDTQNRLVALLTKAVAAGGPGYARLRDWQQRERNRAIEPEYLTDNLAARGYSPAHISAALSALEQRRDKTRALEQGMMQELLTGKTRLASAEQGDAAKC